MAALSPWQTQPAQGDDLPLHLGRAGADRVLHRREVAVGQRALPERPHPVPAGPATPPPPSPPPPPRQSGTRPPSTPVAGPASRWRTSGSSHGRPSSPL